MDRELANAMLGALEREHEAKKKQAGPPCTDAQQIDCMRHNEANWPLPPEVCEQCKVPGYNVEERVEKFEAKMHEQGIPISVQRPVMDVLADAEAARMAKIEKRREDARNRMRKIREANPTYCQPKVNRSTIGYCPACNKDMPWSDAEGEARKEQLRCPTCHGILKRLARAVKIGENPMKRASQSYCFGCKKMGYWQHAKKKRGRLVCAECGGELYSIRDQPVPGRMGGMGGTKKQTGEEPHG